LGTASRILGVIILLIGLPMVVIAITRDPLIPGIFFTGLVLIGIGILLVIKYDTDKKKEKKNLEN
jgi:hypothetical protein